MKCCKTYNGFSNDKTLYSNKTQILSCQDLIICSLMIFQFYKYINCISLITSYKGPIAASLLT